MAVTDSWYAKVPFTYGKQRLDKGQIFTLRNLRNDQLLLDHNYIGVVNLKVHHLISCDNCGTTFIGSDFRNLHKRKKQGCVGEQEITKRESAELFGKDEHLVEKYNERLDYVQQKLPDPPESEKSTQTPV